jgi:predicted nucleotidyltransferase
MHEVIDQYRLQIAELCQRYEVQLLEVFGSAARSDFNPVHSDYVLIHGYDTVNDEVTRRIIEDKLPVLISELDTLISSGRS